MKTCLKNLGIISRASLTILIAVFAIAGFVEAVTNIGTNISTDGSLNVAGGAIISSTTAVTKIEFGGSTSSEYAIIGPSSAFLIRRDGRFDFAGSGSLGDSPEDIIDIIGELRIGPQSSPNTVIGSNWINSSGSLTVSGTTTIDNGTFYVDSGNNLVGVGTTSPSKRLTVDGDVLVSGVLTMEGLPHALKNNGTVAEMKIESTLNNAMLTVTSGSSSVSGIRFNTQADSNGWQIYGNSEYFGVDRGGNEMLGVDLGGNIGINRDGSDYEANLEVGGSLMVFSNRTSPYSNFIIDESGNVGIGTTTPEVKLQVSNGYFSTSTVEIGTMHASKGSCLKLRDVDGAGWTYCTTLDGVMTCSITSCE